MEKEIELFYKELDKQENDKFMLRHVYNVLEDKLIAKEFDVVNRILERCYISKYSMTVLISFLCSTYLWRRFLPMRNSLYEKIKIKAEESISLMEKPKFMKIYEGLK